MVRRRCGRRADADPPRSSRREVWQHHPPQRLILKDQRPRICAFFAENSSSVRMPCECNSASSLICSIESSSAGAAGGGGGGAAACCSAICCSYAAWSCDAYLLSCRRRTRPLTTVAVPATTA